MTRGTASSAEGTPHRTSHPLRRPMAGFLLALSALPRLTGFLTSLVVHVGAAGAFIAFSSPAGLQQSRPEPQAIAIEFVAVSDFGNAETAAEAAESKQQTGQDEDADAQTDAVFPEDQPVDEPEPAAAITETETEEPALPDREPEEEIEAAIADTVPALPDAAPFPAPRPRQAQRKASETPPPAETVEVENSARSPGSDDTSNELPELAGNVSATSGGPASRQSSGNAAAEQQWLGKLSAHLERRKRYPRTAMARKMEGVVQIRFLVAPDGTVLASEIVRSSGTPDLDGEALDLLRRASPVPPPPPEIKTLVTVPISFSLRG